MIHAMRTTLDIDDDVLQAAKELGEYHRKTAGQVLSELARKALEPKPHLAKVRNGVPLLPRGRRGRIVTPQMVEELLDEP